MLNFKSSIRFVQRTDTGSKSWDEGAKDFDFDTSGNIFTLRQEIASHVFLLEGTLGQADDSFLFRKAALREKGK